jgi:hypothetical protein
MVVFDWQAPCSAAFGLAGLALATDLDLTDFNDSSF